ncbi:MAG: ATP-binding cassette domain-containing protein [Myxococcota bacterium]|nr:ATP-binding cassette domain-containing protein [Myxococcota bacterium]
MSNAIQVTGLEKNYGPIRALDGIDFSISGGEVVGLLGPNGAGKSTAMKIMTGFISASGGSVSVFGKDILSHPIGVKNHLGYLPEATPLYPEMTVGNYLRFIAQVRHLGSAESKRAIDRVLDRCDLKDRTHQSIGTLSKGLKQRVGLAQAMVHDPDILILDEPTSGLDPNQIQEIRRLIREVGETKTVLLSTHILSEVQASCDRVIIISGGQIVADGPTQEVTRMGQKEALHTLVSAGSVRLSSDEIKRGLEAVEGVLSVDTGFGAELGEDEHLMIIRSETDVRRAVSQWVHQRGLLLLEQRREQKNLEEVFRTLTT